MQPCQALRILLHLAPFSLVMIDWFCLLVDLGLFVTFSAIVLDSLEALQMSLAMY